VHLLRSRDLGLLEQFSLAGFHYTQPPKPQSHPGHSTIVPPLVLLETVSPAWEVGMLTRTLKLHPLTSVTSAPFEELSLPAQLSLTGLRYTAYYIQYNYQTMQLRENAKVFKYMLAKKKKKKIHYHAPLGAL